MPAAHLEILAGLPVADVEVFAGAVRVFPPGGKVGDRYLWSCAWRATDRDTAELCAVLTSPPNEYRRAIARELLRLGFKWAVSKKADGRQKRWDLARLAKHQ